MREVSACRSLARDVNQTLTEIEALSKTRGPDQELRIAKNYAALAKRIEPKSTDTTPMATLLREYVTVLRATDSALKNHAEATRSQQTPRVNESRRELDRLVKRERSAVTRIDVECHQ